MTTKARKRVVIYGSIVFAVLLLVQIYMLIARPVTVHLLHFTMPVICLIGCVVSDQERRFIRESKLESSADRGQSTFSEHLIAIIVSAIVYAIHC